MGEVFTGVHCSDGGIRIRRQMRLSSLLGGTDGGVGMSSLLGLMVQVVGLV